MRFRVLQQLDDFVVSRYNTGTRFRCGERNGLMAVVMGRNTTTFIRGLPFCLAAGCGAGSGEMRGQL
jgi:hypothetical protein